MKESAERVQYITEYVVSYKAKIEALNKKGLFDTATLYELFSQKVCEIWFGHKFLNLNDSKANYPYVDLISEDGKMYVQVSTGQDIPTKVKSTLEKIRDSKSDELKSIEQLFFFVLANSSESKVMDFSGKERIGRINFIKSKNLITTENIVQKAKTDIEFQKKLYDFLLTESESVVQISNKLNEAITISKVLINNNIDCLINDEYIIDRSSEISQIRKDGFNFISIQGEAGSGKSALCKLLLEKEKMVLYTRAEKIAEVSSLEDIWGLDIGKTIEYLKKKKLYIYIDALEFIVDCSKTKMDLLQQIYEIVKGHNNIFIITSCRTCDRTAFVKIENIYQIKRYDIFLLSDKQIIKVAQKYKIVQKLWDAKGYVQLLRSPFYLNLLVKEIKDFKKISDIDGFRNLIWNDIMCMSGKTFPQGITHSAVREAIEKIVFNRAEKFLPGVRKEEIGEEIVNILQSENIITTCSNNTIRLKYDIFEDICFERFIDEKYDDCKNDFGIFFLNLEKMGRCIYRRYQIWVENKLFSKGNREKFLYKLLETDNIPSGWKVQTIVGIVKSNFCSELFEEYKYYFSNDLLHEFLRLTNIFSFETSILNFKYGNVYSQLKPIGMGRPCLINLIFNNGMYKEKSREKAILKLCTDYSQNPNICDEAEKSACQILQFFIEEKMKNSLKEKDFNLADGVNLCLMPIYKMAKCSHEWIKHFWSERIFGYLNSDGRSNRLDKEILKYVLKNTVPALAIYLPKELCEVADAYWIKIPKCDARDSLYRRSSLDSVEKFGLSRNSDSYHFEYRNIYDNAFLNILITYNWVMALEWLIKLTNHMALAFRESVPEAVYDICVWENSTNEARNYICSPDFWLAGIQEHRVHELVSDGIFLFTRYAINIINTEIDEKNKVVQVAEYIKSEVIKKSNNVIMLSVIAEIGRNCKNSIPGYSLFLASSIDLVMLDSQKIRSLVPNADMQLYEKLILMSVGLSGLEKRYNIGAQENDSLQNIVLELQLRDDELKEKTERILDYLYSIISNQGEDAKFYLQIQKMDLRNAAVSKVDDHTYALIPQVTGDAKKIVEKNSCSKFVQNRNEFKQLIDTCCNKMHDGRFSLLECFDVITRVQLLIENMEAPGLLQNFLVMIIAYALTKDEITTEQRSKLCGIWLKGIDGIFNNGSFAFEIGLVSILYKQIEYELEEDIKIQMKKQMFNCLLYRGQQGIITKVSSYLKKYLQQNEKIAQLFFYTIIAIAEDQMACYKYNVNKLCGIGEKIDYQPNRKKPPVWVKRIFEKNGIGLYNSKREEIIQKYLIREKKKDLSTWNIENGDLQTLCYVSNCGLSFDNHEFSMIMRKIFPYLLSIISNVEDYDEFIDVYAVDEVITFISNGLCDKDSSAIVDMLFDLPDFGQMSSDGYELYEEIAAHLLAVYFDAYKNIEIRRKCEVTLLAIEDKISHICELEVRNNLCKMMFLTLGKIHMHDWNELHTEYSYKDKMFLNEIWSKYGWLHFKNLLYVINQMHITELLPEVILPLNESLRKCGENYADCKEMIKANAVIINKIITKAFLDFNDDIKCDHELVKAFEEVLETLVGFGMEEAAVILDEFRVH